MKPLLTLQLLCAWLSAVVTIASGSVSTSVARDALFDHRTLSPRSLQSSTVESTRECNSQIGLISRDEVLAILNILYSEGGTELVAYINGVLAPLLKYDVASYKICGTCLDFDAAAAASVCDGYGNDAPHSSLVLVPMDPDTGNVVQGSLRTSLLYHGTRIDADDVATNTFPASVSEGLQELQASGDAAPIGALLASMGEALPGIVQASLGNVAIVPDYLGYGASLPTHNRTYVVRRSYEQATLVSWYATQAWLSQASGGCSEMDGVVSMEGTSEGSYAALASSSLLGDMGVRILDLRLNVPVVSLEAILVYMMVQYDGGLISPTKDNAGYTVFSPLSAWAYSQDLQHVANSGDPNQTLLAEEWMVDDTFDRNIPAWLESPDPVGGVEIASLMPLFVPDIFHPAMIQLARDAIAVNSTTPCNTFADELVERGIDKLCEASLDNDLLELLASGVTYPTEICYSSEDTIVPAFQFTDDIFANEFVSRTVGLDGLPVGEGADHGAAAGACIFHNLLVYLAAGVTPGISEDDMPYLITPLEDMPETCGGMGGGAGTPPPTPDTGASSGAIDRNTAFGRYLGMPGLLLACLLGL